MRKSTALDIAYRRARTRSDFLARDFDRYQALTRLDDDHLARALRVAPEDLVRLGLCGTPRRDGHFAEDVMSIAGRVDGSVVALARMLRILDGITGLQQVPSSFEQTLLLAARDRGTETTRPSLPPVGIDVAPKWLVDGVAMFWTPSEAPNSYPRDLELPILLNLPLGIIEIEGLSVELLNDWLRTFDIDVLRNVADRRLRGCLMAYAGVGLIVVDATDDAQERRESLAHEAGHFLSDYLLPRRYLETYAPELVDIIDGVRDAEESDRLQAVLAQVQLGMHLKLFERTAGGGFINVQSDVSEESAARLAWEILAPAAEVKRAFNGSKGEELREVLEVRFGLSPMIASEYGHYLAKSWGFRTGIKDWLELNDDG